MPNTFSLAQNTCTCPSPVSFLFYLYLKLPQNNHHMTNYHRITITWTTMIPPNSMVPSSLQCPYCNCQGRGFSAKLNLAWEQTDSHCICPCPLSFLFCTETRCYGGTESRLQKFPEAFTSVVQIHLPTVSSN